MSGRRNRLKAVLLDWPATFVFLPAFIGILVLFDPVQRVVIRFSRRTHEKVIVMLNALLVLSLKLCGAAFEFDSPPGKLSAGPVLVISNHQSMFDIPILHTIFATKFPRFISKKELAKWIPSVSYNLRKGGNAIIDRKNPRQAVSELMRFSERLSAQGFAAVIFPEGTRARDGKLKKFRAAGLATLIERVPELQVVPAAIEGSYRLAMHGLLPVPFGSRLTVKIGEPVMAAQFTSVDELVEHCWRFSDVSLREIREGSLSPEPLVC